PPTGGCSREGPPPAAGSTAGAPSRHAPQQLRCPQELHSPRQCERLPCSLSTAQERFPKGIALCPLSGQPMRMATDTPKSTGTLRTGIAEEIRALLGRREISKLDLSRRIGKSHTYV